ncbi:Dak1-domain-containing protein [Ramaria rubella]|nr:Dak1-domain-containing protein [Ramaria rubella]
MSSKHIFNDPENLVVQSLRGAVILNPALRLHAATKSAYVSREVALLSKARVMVIAGGGAGHEPASVSYTGLGMLRSSVSGDIFASPSASQIRTAINLALAASSQSLNDVKEVLLVVNNYTGDRMNFGLAAEMVRSQGVDVATVTVADDVAVGRTPLGLVGRRGLAGYVLVCKILGAAAEHGLSLSDVAALGNAVTANLASIGLSLDHCHIPGKGKKIGDWEKLDEEACELGLGLHNEKGLKRLTSTPQPKEMISLMLKPLLDPDDAERSFVSFSKATDEEVIVFLNNLGGLSQLEMGALVEEVHTVLNIHPSRIYASSYMTSLNAPGFSISLLNVSSAKLAWNTASSNTHHLTIPQLLDDPTDALAWAGVRSHWTQHRNLDQEELESDILVQAFQTDAVDIQGDDESGNSMFVESVVRTVAQAVLRAESQLTHYDTVCGDGDCGTTFAAGAKALLRGIEASTISFGNGVSTALSLARTFENNMGGTSGALFAIYFTSLSYGLQTTSSWREACFKALQSLTAYTPARPGDRTLIDALEPFCTSLRDGNSLVHAAEAARRGAEGTKGMPPKLGRAVYLEQNEGQSYLVPDPGAWGVMVIVESLVQAFEG